MSWFSKKEEPVIQHCEVGDHDVVDQWISTCAECERGMCHEHQGNPDTLAGNLVACPEHVAQVEEGNRQWWEEYRRKHQ